MSLSSIAKDRRLIICCGSGGVGKTTTSAAIALAAAIEGRKTLVITIDPARRLAQSLGLTELDNSAQKIDIQQIAGSENSGELYASMLDTAASLDSLIDRITNSPEQAKRIKANNIYRQFANAIGGSTEYVAMERLYELADSGEYDLIILDTPPTKNALDFLSAPNRLSAFLDENVVKWFVRKPKGGMGSLLFQKGGEVVFRLLALLIGESLIHDLTEFFQAFAGLYDGFGDRARKVNKLIRDPATVFVLVTSAERGALSEAEAFYKLLVEADIPIQAVVVNRAYELLSDESIDETDLTQWLREKAAKLGADKQADPLAPRLAEKLATLRDTVAKWNEAANENVDYLRKILRNGESVTCVPIFSEEIYDVPGLMKMNRYLFSKSD